MGLEFMGKQTNTSKDWVLLAEDDLAIAEHISATMNPIPTSGVAFHCQQAAEKYLRGTLITLGIEPPYSHDLVLLYNLLEKHRSSFVSIFSSCAIITQFSVQPRYDRGLSLSYEDIQLVLSHTQIIKDFLQKEVPELFMEIKS